MTANGDDKSDWDLFSAIRKEELAASIVSGRVQVVNVLEAPKAGRLRLIAHSRHIPLSELEERVGELDRGRDVVVYCKNRECPASLKAARVLAEQGFHVRAYEGGIEEWVAAGLPTDADTKKLPRTETAALDASASSVRTPRTEGQAESAETESAETESAETEKQTDDVPPTERTSQVAAAPREEKEEREEKREEEEEAREDDEDEDKEMEEREAEPRAAAAPQQSSASSATSEPPEDSKRPMANSFLDCLSAPPSERSA